MIHIHYHSPHFVQSDLDHFLASYSLCVSLSPKENSIDELDLSLALLDLHLPPEYIEKSQTYHNPTLSQFHPHQTSSARSEGTKVCGLLTLKYLSLNSIRLAKFGHRGGGWSYDG